MLHTINIKDKGKTIEIRPTLKTYDSGITTQTQAYANTTTHTNTN